MGYMWSAAVVSRCRREHCGSTAAKRATIYYKCLKKGVEKKPVHKVPPQLSPFYAGFNFKISLLPHAP